MELLRDAQLFSVRGEGAPAPSEAPGVGVCGEFGLVTLRRERIKGAPVGPDAGPCT